LDDFISRRSEYRRYWLFGFLVEQPLDLQMDLLGAAPETGRQPVDVARRRAKDVFLRRVNAAPVHRNDLTSAHLTIRTQGERIDQGVAGVPRTGREVTFRITAVHKGLFYEAERAQFVAQHDPAVEQKSEPPFDEGEGRDT